MAHTRIVTKSPKFSKKRNRLLIQKSKTPYAPDPIESIEYKRESSQIKAQYRNKIDKLVKTHRCLENSKSRYITLYTRYADIFNFAPVGYIIIGLDEIIKEANQTVVNLMAATHRSLIGQPFKTFIHPDDQDSFHFFKLQCMESPRQFSIEVKMVTGRGASFHARLFGRVRSYPGSQAQIWITVMDISEEVLKSRITTLVSQCIIIANRHTKLTPFMNDLVGIIKEFTGCEAVGIRIRLPDGRIPYQAYDGFSDAFFALENGLSIHVDKCMCIYVIRGETNPDLPFFTARGSFYTNGSTRLLATIPEGELLETRNICNEEGYESVALVPIAMASNTLGLIHIADRAKNKVPLPVVEGIESLAVHLGAILNKYTIQDELERSLKMMELLSRQLIITREDEQRRIAMGLHDSLGQTLNVLKLQLISFLDGLRNLNKKQASKVDSILHSMDQTIEEVRRIARGLMPPVLEKLGLDAAIQYLVRNLKEHSCIRVVTELIPISHCFDHEEQVIVFRIMQEAIVNILKHANAKTVWITISQNDGAIFIRIRDDGKGLPAEHMVIGIEDDDMKPSLSGLGIPGMKLRAQMIRAELCIFTPKGNGTEISISIPLSQRGSRNE